MISRFQPQINNWFAAEENRLARLKIFCEAVQLNFYAANEEICKVVNDSAYNYYLSPQEVQDRFVSVHSVNMKDIDLGHPHFWDLFWYRRFKTQQP